MDNQKIKEYNRRGDISMRKIEFKNGMGWKKVISHIYDKSGKLNKKVLLKEKGSQGDYSVVLGETDHHLCFSNSITKRTSTIYPGNISIVIKHEFNDNKKFVVSE